MPAARPCALQWAWCRRQAGIPLMVQGRQVVIDRPVEARGKCWVCGDLELGRAEKVALTKVARRIIAEKVISQPPWAFPPEISSQECLKAIEHTGGVTIMHRGEELHITEIVTRGTHWWSGDMRLTPARFSNSGTPGAPLRGNAGAVRHSERCGVSCGAIDRPGRNRKTSPGRAYSTTIVTVFEVIPAAVMATSTSPIPARLRGNGPIST